MSEYGYSSPHSEGQPPPWQLSRGRACILWPQWALPTLLTDRLIQTQ